MEHKKQSGLSRILEYAGGHKRLTLLGCALSALSAVLGLIPYVCVWLVARGIIGGSRSKPIPLGLDSGSACHYQHLPLFCGADVYPYRRLQNSAKHAQRGQPPASCARE